MKLTQFESLTENFPNSDPFPILFFGHGNPMNAIEENPFTQQWQAVGKQIPRPTAILCISAHWETKGTHVTAMKTPKTIHDFGGFPDELYAVQYPAEGSLSLAKKTQKILLPKTVSLDEAWGLDHGAWSVLKHVFPAADIPVIQLSLDRYETPAQHYELGQRLSALRRKNVLIIGSGNIVHNLSRISFSARDSAYDWALEANSILSKLITEDNHQALINYQALGSAISLSIPTPEHYLPLLYILAMKIPQEQITFFNEKTVLGSISMTSLSIT